MVHLLSNGANFVYKSSADLKSAKFEFSTNELFSVATYFNYILLGTIKIFFLEAYSM